MLCNPLTEDALFFGADGPVELVRGAVMAVKPGERGTLAWKEMLVPDIGGTSAEEEYRKE